MSNSFVVRTLIAGALVAASAWTQSEPPSPPPPMQRHGPMMRGLRPGLPGRWWNDPQVAQELELSAGQRTRMDDIFQQSRFKLIDLSADLQKEEATLEPLLSADTPDESKFLVQIDRVAQARAELEKANATMLFRVRSVLTKPQWQKLQTEHPFQRPGRRSGILPATH